MTLKGDTKFKVKLTSGFKYNMNNLVIFTKPLKSLKISF